MFRINSARYPVAGARYLLNTTLYGILCYMNTHVLEIGSGRCPAILYPGKIFADDDAQYTAIEARRSEIDKFVEWDGDSLDGYAEGVIIADSTELPLPDQSFSSVIMRSVFGEYTDRPESTGSTLENTDMGICEAFRVLQNDGEIVVAEENTPRAPATPYRIGSNMLYAGFEDIVVYPCQNMENPDWHEARTKYWGMRENSSGYVAGKPIDASWGFLVRATRPKTETKTFEGPVYDKSAWRENNKRGWGHPDNMPMEKTATFQRSVRELPELTDGRPWPHYSMIKIVTKDSEMDLETYMNASNKNEIPQLFD